MTRRPPRSTLFPYTDALPIWSSASGELRRVLVVMTAIPSSYIRCGYMVSLSAITTTVAPSRQFLGRSEEHTSELQSQFHLVCRLLLEKKKIDVAHIWFERKIR